MDSSMWPTMWMENIAMMYMPRPEDVVRNMMTHPSDHAAVRLTGHSMPRRCNRHTPQR